MITEAIDKLFLELSQVTNATTAKEIKLQKRVEELEDLLTSARSIAERGGADTHWPRFSERLAQAGIGSVTAKVFKILPSDLEPDETDSQWFNVLDARKDGTNE